MTAETAGIPANWHVLCVYGKTVDESDSESESRLLMMENAAAMELNRHHPKICIVGTQQLQYELLSFSLENELSVKCFIYNELPLNLSTTIKKECLQVWMFDCFGLDATGIEQQYGNMLGFLSEGLLKVLFNVEKLKGLNDLVLEKGIRGIFLRNDSREDFLKGIRTILDGKMWLTRKTLSECLLAGQTSLNPVVRGNQILTDREKEILLCVAAGSSNKQIAMELCVSIHTVKAHLFKIYRKINVRNRLMATLWANTYLIEDQRLKQK